MELEKTLGTRPLLSMILHTGTKKKKVQKEQIMLSNDVTFHFIAGK